MFWDKKPFKFQKAFTIMELMIVVVIISILAMLVYPNYMDSVRKSRRSDAKGALLSFANAMERRYTEFNSYCGMGTDDNLPCVAAMGVPATFPTTSPIDGTTAYYNLEIRVATADTYNLRAIATGTQLGDGNLEINNTETRGRWDRNADGDTVDANESTWD